MSLILPNNRIVDATLVREDRFATRRGFGVPLILTSDTDTTSPVDASTRTKVYGSFQEIALDWDSASSVYREAQAMFSQNPRPLQVKVGFVDPGTLATVPNPTIADELDAVYNYDRDWYWLTLTDEFRDTSILDSVAAWVEAKPIIFGITSNDVNTESPSDTSSFAARIKGQFTRTFVFYSRVVAQCPASALMAVTSRFNYDEANSAYTAKFKFLAGITPSNITSAVDQAVTGFIPAIGLSAVAGHFANVYVNQAGIFMTKEGTLANGSFIDEQHFVDWILARTEEEVISCLANNQRVEYDDPGFQVIASVVEGVVNRGVQSGAIADDFQINVPRRRDVPSSQARQRIMPPVFVRFRYVGAVHYVTVRYTLTF